MKNKPTDQPITATSDDPNFDKFFANKYRAIGERIERVLASSKVSNEVKNIFVALVAEAAIEAGFSIPDKSDIARKLPKIFDALGKSGSAFVCYFNAIETSLDHGTKKTKV